MNPTHRRLVAFCLFVFAQFYSSITWAYNPKTTFNDNVPVSEPTVQTSGIFVLKSVHTSVYFRWNVGDGAKRIVVARQGSAVNADPVDNVAYTSDAFGAGSQIGTGNYVVYSGTADRATITGLTSNTTYYFKIYEFNESGGEFNYLTTSPPSVNITTLPPGDIAMSDSTLLVTSGKYYASGGTYYYGNNETFTQTLSPANSGTKLKLVFNDFFLGETTDVLKIYDGATTSSPLIGTYQDGNSPGVVTATNEGGHLTFQFTSDALFTSIGWDADISYFILEDEPAEPATYLNFSSTTSTSTQLNWTNGNGDKRMVVARLGSPVTFLPSDGNSYIANSIYGNGEFVGTDEFVIYNGTGNSVTVTGLSATTTYHFAVFEFNGDNTSSNYLNTAAAGSLTTTSMASEPSQEAGYEQPTYVTHTSATLHWSKGNGTRRMVVVGPGAYDLWAVEDGTSYEPNSVYGEGSNTSADNYVVYDGTGDSVTVTGLSPGVYYNYYVYEYNGTGASKNYLHSYDWFGFTTLKWKPTVPASNVSITNITANSMKINWVRGNGDYVAVIARATQPITTSGIKDSVEVEIYHPYAYGTGSEVSDGVAVYLGSETSVVVTGLSPNVTYHFAVVEVNRNYADDRYINYFSTSIPVKSAKTLVGKKFFWVGGNGKWSEYSTHWATTSGGKTFHKSVPTLSDDVIFDANSFTADGQEVLIDTSYAYCMNMDWSAVTKTVTLETYDTANSSCSVDLFINGSLKLSEKLNTRVTRIHFISTQPGNVLDLAGHIYLTSHCGTSLYFQGYKGEWTLLADSLDVSYIYLDAGKFIARNAKIRVTSMTSWASKYFELDLQDSELTLNEWRNYYGTGKTIGGTLKFNNYWGYGQVDLAGTHFQKVSFEPFSKFRLLGGGTIDTLVVEKAVTLSLEAGKTVNVSELIIRGAETEVALLNSTVSGSAATISQASGTVNGEYVFLQDNIATGGATFNAKNSISINNVSGWNVTKPNIFTPKTSVADFRYTKVLKTGLSLKWTKGSATHRMIIGRKGEPVNKVPVDDETYPANEVFGLGTDLGDNNFVVYNGSVVDTVSLEGFEPGALYYFTIIEYNSWNDSTRYSPYSWPLSVEMLEESDIVISNDPITVCNAAYFDDGGTGSYDGYKHYVQTITPATSGTKLGIVFNSYYTNWPDDFKIYDGANTSAPVLWSYYSSGYPSEAIIATNSSGVLTFEFTSYGPHDYAPDGWRANLFCAGTPANEPTIQVTQLQVIDTLGTSVKLKVQKGNGTGRMVIARAYYPVDKFPVDRATFTPNATFGEGADLGYGNYVVYAGSADTIVVNGLNQTSTYYFAAIEFNGSEGSINYLLSDSATVKVTTTYATPTLPSKSLTFMDVAATRMSGTLTTGNGIGRIIFARKNSEVSFVPQDGVEYTASEYFGSGQNVGDSTYAIYELYGQNFQVYHLKQSSTYFFKIYEFNGFGKNIKYLTSESLSGSQATTGPKIYLSSFQPMVSCPNGDVNVYLSTDGTFKAGTTFSLELSDSIGSFDSPTVVTSSQTAGYTYFKVPNELTGSELYKLRAVATPENIYTNELGIVVHHVPEVSITLADGVFTSSLADSIQWFLNNDTIPGAIEQTYGNIKAGSYTVKVKSDGCYKVSNEIVITSIDAEFTKHGFKIYPNPAEDEVFIESPEPGMLPFEFYDLNGRAVKNGNLNGRKTSVKIGDLPGGLYIVRIVANNKVVTGKVVKK